MAKKKKKISNALEIQNAAKTMLANIRFASVDSSIQSIVVTSSIPNEGKTTTVIELAKAIASSNNSVLVIEADMRRRNAAAMLGVHAPNGAYAVMTNAVSLQDAVISTGVTNLFFLDIEPNIPNPADLLSSRAYSRLVDEVCDHFDYVLFDTPPVGTFVDAAVLSRLVDGVIMVVKIGGAKRDEILAAYDQLQKAEANIIGACATFCESSGSEYYYAYYSKNNERVDSNKEKRNSKKGSTAVSPKTSSLNSSHTTHGNHGAGSGRRGNHSSSVSNSQSWKKSSVQVGVQQARRSNTPRTDQSQLKRR